MPAFFLDRQYRNYLVLGLALLPCFWPVSRYSVDEPAALVDSIRFRYGNTTGNRIEARDTNGHLYFISIVRHAWKCDASENFPGAPESLIGEESTWRDNGSLVRFRRHNLEITVETTSGSACALFDLAYQVDGRIRRKKGSRLSIDTRGNQAFQKYIKPKLAHCRSWIRSRI